MSFERAENVEENIPVVQMEAEERQLSGSVEEQVLKVGEAVILEEAVKKSKKGRPKGCTKNMSRKDFQDEEEWQETVRVRQRPAPKEESILEGYIHIIDFLHKIDFDAAGVQHKMNPYNCLTANCFWYTVAAEYFSHDFFLKRTTPSQAAQQIIDKINKIPLQIANRGSKPVATHGLLPFQTEQLSEVGKELAVKLNALISTPLINRNEVIERKINITTSAEDDLFISSTRAVLFNFIQNKMRTSEKWNSAIQGFLESLPPLASKDFEGKQQIEFLKPIEQKEEFLEEHLRRKKKIDPKGQEILKGARSLQAPQLPIQEDSVREHNSLPQNVYNEMHKPEINQQPEVNQQPKMHQSQGHQQPEMHQPEMHQPEMHQPEMHQLEEQVSSSRSPSEEQVGDIFTKQYGWEQALLDGILHLPIDKVISILQSTLPTTKLPTIQPPFMPVPSKDPLQFVYQLHEDEERYLQVMKAHQRKRYRDKVNQSETIIEEEEREGQYEDAKCQICTDGDYTEDNLIVFCSMCNISLHQRCVGLAKVPLDSWVCEVCAAFGPAGINLPCPLCNVKGGAMKRTNIHIDSTLFRQTNPGYYEYAKKCVHSKTKEEYLGQKENLQNGYYDYFVKSTYPTDEPFCHSVWVHYVCAIWIPECYFEEKSGTINVKGIENIEKKRYRYDCFVCKRSRSGAAVKCEDGECDKYYHPECARKKKVYMQQLNLQKLKYLIFCEEHQPLKLTRQIQYKKKKAREEIFKFTRMIEKYIETYKIASFPYKLFKMTTPASLVAPKPREEEKKEPSKITDQDFLKHLMETLAEANQIKVQIEKVENGYRIIEVQQPSKREIRKCLNRYDQFWNNLSNGDNNEENFKRYERIVVDNARLREKLECFLNGNLTKAQQVDKTEKKVGRKRGKHAVSQAETMMEEEGGIFCICRRPYQGEKDMFECEICGEWYHFNCVGFIGTEEDVRLMEFHCMKCMKFQDQYVKRVRIEKHGHLFSPGCAFYTYRPPTPELVSGDQQEATQKNQSMQIEVGPAKESVMIENEPKLPTTSCKEERVQ